MSGDASENTEAVGNTKPMSNVILKNRNIYIGVCVCVCMKQKGGKMEKIKIKAIDKKDSGLVIVKYVVCEYVGMPDAEATLNTKWQSQEVDYLEKDVGIGGKVKVTIVQKDKYTNITKVDFSSAEKGDTVITESEKVADVPKDVGLMSVKDINITSQCLTKAWVQTDKEPKEILDAYRFFVLELEQNG